MVRVLKQRRESLFLALLRVRARVRAWVRARVWAWVRARVGVGLRLGLL